MSPYACLGRSTKKTTGGLLLFQDVDWKVGGLSSKVLLQAVFRRFVFGKPALEGSEFYYILIFSDWSSVSARKLKCNKILKGFETRLRLRRDCDLHFDFDETLTSTHLRLRRDCDLHFDFDETSTSTRLRLRRDFDFE